VRLNILPEHAKNAIRRLESASAVHRISENHRVSLLRHGVFLAEELTSTRVGGILGGVLRERKPAVVETLRPNAPRNARINLGPDHRVVGRDCHCEYLSFDWVDGLDYIKCNTHCQQEVINRLCCLVFGFYDCVADHIEQFQTAFAAVVSKELAQFCIGLLVFHRRDCFPKTIVNGGVDSVHCSTDRLVL